MPKNVQSLLLSCLDSFEQLSKLQELLEIALEQFEDFPEQPEKVRSRLEVLIDCYRSFADDKLDQMQADLTSIRKQLVGED